MKTYAFLAIVFVLAVSFIIDQRFRFTSVDSLSVKEFASTQCISKRGDNQPPLPFRYDGCTSWLNGNWLSCCAEHDAVYWCGGSKDDRLQADIALKECVNEKTPLIGSVMYVAVRITGVPWIPKPTRWGFGWHFGKGYE